MGKFQWSLALCCLLLSPLHAADLPFTLNLPADLPLELAPRSQATVVVTVENQSAQQAELRLAVQLPENWKQLIPLPLLQLPAGESDFLLIHFFVPQGIPAGTYQLGYRLADRAEFFLEGGIPVIILAEEKLELKLLTKPEYVVAGEEYFLEYLVLNTGNTELNLRVGVNSSESFAWELQLPAAAAPIPAEEESFPPDLPAAAERLPAAGTELEISEPADQSLFRQASTDQLPPIAPGQPFSFRVQLKTAATLKKILNHRVTLSLQGTAAEAKPVTTYVEVIPRISGEQDLYYRIPLQINYRTSHRYLDQYQGDVAINLQSKGYLDEEHGHHLELEIEKELDFREPAFFDPADQYTVEYRNSFMQLAAGDKGYGLSPLTENFSYGRGLGADFQYQGFSLGGYLQKNVWADAALIHAGVSAGYRLFNASLPGDFRYAVNLSGFGALGDSLLFSLYQQYQPLAAIKLQAELAAGAFRDEELQFAGLFRGNGDHGWLTYDLEYLYAAPRYPGAYRDLQLVGGNLGFRLLAAALKIYGGYRTDIHNLLLDPTLPAAALNSSAQAGVEYFWALLRTEFALLWKNNNQQDRLPEPDFAYQENLFQLKINQPLPPFKLQPALEILLLTDRLDPHRELNQDYSLGVEYQPAESVLLALLLNYHYRDDAVDAVQHKILWGISSELAFPSLNLALQFKNSYTFSDAASDALDFTLNLGADYTFRNSSRLSGNLSYLLYHNALGWNTNFHLQLEYHTPLQVPLGRKKSIGTIEGVITNQLNGWPIPGVIVRTGGYSAITDEAGHYIFPGLRPGEYYLNLDRQGLAKGFIPVTALPAKVIVEQGAVVTLDLQLTAAAVISGRLFLYDFKDASDNFTVREPDQAMVSSEAEFSSREASGLLVEISNGREFKRRLTDKRGYFRFEELVPGPWQLKVLDYNIPRYHYIEQEIFDIVLQPEDLYSFEIRILPVKRIMQMIEEGGTLIAE